MAFQRAVSVPGEAHRGNDTLQVHRALPEEVPVAMVFNGTTHAVMMATPADLEDFAIGFAMTERIITGVTDVESLEIVHHGPGIEARFWLTDGTARALAKRRRSLAGTVGCGLCGIDSLSEAARDVPTVSGWHVRLSRRMVAQAGDDLRRLQPLHDRTRATHAAGFLDPARGMIMAREDVGRHNALDKLTGALARTRASPAHGAFVMTSRLSVDLVQKCAIAGCPAIIAVSAPTAFALRVAETSGITVAAFARGDGFDVYSHPRRITDEVYDVA